MRDPIFLTRTRKEIASDNHAELEAWIDERVAALIAEGVDPDDARLRALEEFGDVHDAECYAEREDIAADRRVRVLLRVEELASDLRIAARTLARTPAVTAVVLLTFALGIGAATAVFSVVYAMLLRPLPYGDEARLVQFQPVENGVIRPAARFSAAAVAGLRDRTTSFSGISAIDGGNAVVLGGGDPEQIAVSAVTPDAFDVLRVRAAMGRTFGAHEVSGPAGRVAVLLDGLWRRRFGADPGIVGRTIEFAEGRLEVIGVMPPDFRVPTYEAAEFLAPRNLASLLRNSNSAQVRAIRIFARLKPGVSMPAAQMDVDQAMLALQREFPQSFAGITTRVVPIRTAVAGDARPRLLVLMGAAAFVLLIACANVAGILLARALARDHELAVRVALGAGRPRLIRQFLAEGAVLAVVGAGLGLLVAQAGIRVLRTVAAASLPPGTEFTLEPRVLLFAIGAAMGSARILASSRARRDARARHRAAAPRRPHRLACGPWDAPHPRRCATGCFDRPTRRRRSLPSDLAAPLGARSWLFDGSCSDLQAIVYTASLECGTGRVLDVAARAAARASRRRNRRRRKRSDGRSEHHHRTPDRRPRGRRRPSARRAIHAGVG